MDLGIIAALAMLVVWGIATFAFDAPGWIHALLSAGMFLLIWRIVALDRDRPEKPGGKR